MTNKTKLPNWVIFAFLIFIITMACCTEKEKQPPKKQTYIFFIESEVMSDAGSSIRSELLSSIRSKFQNEVDNYNKKNERSINFSIHIITNNILEKLPLPVNYDIDDKFYENPPTDDFINSLERSMDHYQLPENPATTIFGTLSVIQSVINNAEANEKIEVLYISEMLETDNMEENCCNFVFPRAGNEYELNTTQIATAQNFLEDSTSPLYYKHHINNIRLDPNRVSIFIKRTHLDNIDEGQYRLVEDFWRSVFRKCGYNRQVRFE